MRLLSFLLVIFSAAVLFPQNYSKVEIYLESHDAVTSILSAGINLDHCEHTRSNSVITYISEDEVKLLAKAGISYKVLIDDWAAYYKSLPVLSPAEKENILNNSKEQYGVTGLRFGSMGGFYTYAEAINDLDSMRAKYPHLISQKYEVGTTVGGRKIWGVKISDNPDSLENEPASGFDALIHAREPASMSTLIYFMWYLLENYSTKTEVSYLVNSREIYCIPVLNPDGYDYNRQASPNGGGMWRKNRSLNGTYYGVDLNRNFPFKWGFDNIGSSGTPSSESYRGPSAASEKETQAAIAFLTGKNVKTFLSMHAYHNAFLYPWGYKNLLTPDSAFYREYSNDMCSYNGFEHGTVQQVLGYLSNGSSRDWHYGEQSAKNKIMSYTMEIGSSTDSFWPPQSRIFPIAQQNYKALMYNALVAGSCLELKKAVYSKDTISQGDTVSVFLTYRNKGQTTSKQYLTITALSLSEHVSFIDNGSWLDSISTGGQGTAMFPIGLIVKRTAPPGTVAKIVYQVKDDAGIMTADTLSFTVKQAISSIGNKENPIQYNLSANYPNPFNPSTIINYSVPSKQMVNLTVYDILGREVSLLVNEVKDKGNYQITFTPGNISAGIYYYQMKAGGYSKTNKMIYLK